MTDKNVNTKTKIANRKARNSGITLVALVVTIVVLLILSGITIATLFGDNGIITGARRAAELTKNAQNDTDKALADLEDYMKVALGEAPKIKEKGKLVPITTKFAKYTDSTSSDVVPIPGGYGVVNDSTANTSNKNTIASGLVISDLANDTLDNEPITVDETSKRGNQFVWVPVSSTQLSRMYDSTNKRGNLYDFSNIDSTTNLPALITYSSTGYREPDILRSTDYGDASDGTKDSSYNGISQLKTVVGIATTGTEATENANVLKNWEKELQDKFDEMIDSVQKYGGFYIGRYETSGLSTDKTTKATVQKGGTVGGPNWYYQYQEIKNMAKENNNITTSMIWGCQFDRTLEWIVETNLKADGTKDYTIVTDSSSWGNYADSTGAAEKDKGSLRTSGYNEAWQKNHIYDLAGNAYDWTIEAYDTSERVFRRRLL